jgi:pimeloyl-ACP methyl ester carboxylesterase
VVTVNELRLRASDGTELFARVYGAATDEPAFVCLPGLTRNSRDFAELATWFGRDRLVLTPDLRGRGESGHDPTGASYRPDVYVDDVRAVLDAAGVERAVFLGTSLGGAVSMQLAAAHPGLVVGLVLNDVGPALEPEGFARIQSYAGKLPPASTWDDVVDRLKVLNAPMVGTIDDDAWQRMARQQWRQHAPGDIRPDHDPAVAAGMALVDPHAIPATWGTFDAIAHLPMLVLRGEVSDLFAATTADEMQRRGRQVRVVTVADRGHCPTLDEPESRDAIAAFLAGL